MAVLDPVTVGRYAYGAGFRGETLAQMIAIAVAESSLKTDNVNTRSGATGLWQILPSAHPEFAGWDLRDPAVNARAAYSVYQSAPSPGRITRNKWTAYGNPIYMAALIPAHAAASAATTAGGLSSAAGAVGGAVSDLYDSTPLGQAQHAAEIAGDAWDTLANPRTWLRVAYVVAGLGLVWMGVARLVTDTAAGSKAAQLVVGGAKAVATKGKAK
jgi:hypothetical protein